MECLAILAAFIIIWRSVEAAWKDIRRKGN
jgi:hypothetical protein